MASPTVRVALERMVRHQRLCGDGDRAALVRVPWRIRWSATLCAERRVLMRGMPTSAPWRRFRSGIRVLAAPGFPAARRPVSSSRRRGRLRSTGPLFGCPLVFRSRAHRARASTTPSATRRCSTRTPRSSPFLRGAGHTALLARLPRVAGASGSVRAAVRAAPLPEAARWPAPRAGWASARGRCSASWRRRGRHSPPWWTLFGAPARLRLSGPAGGDPGDRHVARAMPTRPRFTVRFAAGPGRRRSVTRAAAPGADRVRRNPDSVRQSETSARAACPCDMGLISDVGPTSRSDGVCLYFVLACAITWTLAAPAAFAWRHHQSPAPMAVAARG